MSAGQGARASKAALDTSVATLAIPGLGTPTGIFVLSDGTRLVSSSENTILQIPPSGRLSTIAGNPLDDDGGPKDGQGLYANFSTPVGLTVDMSGNVVIADCGFDAIRSLTKDSVVNTLAGGYYDEENNETALLDGHGMNAHFKHPLDVVVAANGDIFVSDSENHAIRVLTPAGAVRTLCGNGQAGFADGPGAGARFNTPCGLALDKEGNLLVTDCRNNAIRLVTMEGVVSTVAGNGEEAPGFADGEGSAARFNSPNGIVVDRQGTIIIADVNNHRLRKIVGGHVTTLAGSSEPGTADGGGAVARFNKPCKLALDERGRLLVAECSREDTLRVVEACPPLAPPLWMGPVTEDSEAAMPDKTQAKIAALEDYGKMMEDGTLADVVLVVEEERFPAHRVILAARSEYFRGLLLSGMQGGRSEGGVQEIEQVSAGAFRVVLRYLYTAELPESGEGVSGAGGGRRGDGTGLGGTRCGKGKGKGGKGEGQDGEKLKGGGKEAKRQQVLEREVLKAADLFRLEALLQHCVEAFGRGLTVDTAIEQLVWAHSNGPVETRKLATEYFVRNGRRIQTEARETMESLKELPVDVHMELMQAVLQKTR